MTTPIDTAPDDTAPDDTAPDDPVPPRSGPLTGIRVLELGNFIAAPSAGRMLAEFGADVVKVERPFGGDELRRWRLHGGDTSLLFRAIGRNKRSVTLDLRAPTAREIVLRMVADVDVVLENFRPGTLERWGIWPDDLRAVNPDLVLVRISGYGQTGPYRDRPGFGGCRGSDRWSARAHRLPGPAADPRRHQSRRLGRGVVRGDRRAARSPAAWRPWRRGGRRGDLLVDGVAGAGL